MSVLRRQLFGRTADLLSVGCTLTAQDELGQALTDPPIQFRQLGIELLGRPLLGLLDESCNVLEEL
jgi:hypothetical protein